MNVEDLIKRIRVEGWCVIENVIPHAEVHHVRDSILSTATSRSQSMVKGRNGLNGLIAYDQSIAPYLADERVMAINEAMFGKHVRISMTTGVVIEPGYPQSNLHSDYPFGQGYDFRIPAPYPDAPLQLTSLWMLTPFTETNGGTVLVPGSHRYSNNPTGDGNLLQGDRHPSQITATGNPGSVLMFDSRTWHTNGANTSNEQRIAIIARYVAWWFNLNQIIPGLSDYELEAERTGVRADDVVPITQKTYDGLPEKVKPLFRHIIVGQQVLPG